MPASYEQIAGRSVERLAALSDGLFAIAMTLLIIELHTPAAAAIHSDAELGQALAGLAPQIVMYLTGFLTLGIFWVGQQTQLNNFARVDRDLTWIHIAFLAAVALMPFSTALLAEFITYRLALTIYWFNILLLGLGLYVSWSHARRAGLLKEEATGDVTTITRRRIIAYQAGYFACMLLGLLNTYLGVPVHFAAQLCPVAPGPLCRSVASETPSAGLGRFRQRWTPLLRFGNVTKQGLSDLVSI